METIDQIYHWKRLYWQAIERGFEPCQAEEFANRALREQRQVPVPMKQKVHISASYAGMMV
jgi:hypothetical protein